MTLREGNLVSERPDNSDSRGVVDNQAEQTHEIDMERTDSVTQSDRQLIEDSGVISNSRQILAIPEAVYTNSSPLPSFCGTLPSGKLYHVFFSYCSEDREWVRQMVERLESPEYGFKCCYDERDFDLGVPVFQNITKCIHSSKRTVILMSPEFLQSAWCSYETRITMELDLDTRQRLLIPVMLRNCEPPEYIGRLTYMEVQNEHFWERFVTALREDDSTGSTVQESIGSHAIMTGVPFQFNPNFHNADAIVEVPIYQGCKFCPVSPTEFMPNELMRNGLQVTPSEYRDIVTEVTSPFYVGCHGFFNKSLYVFPIISLLIVAGFLIGMYIAFPSLIDFGVVGFSLLTLALILLFVYLTCTLKATHSISRAIEKANMIARTRNLVVIVKEYGWCSCTCDKMSIMFYYYDWRPCHSHLMQFLTEQYSTANEIIPHDFRERASLIEPEEIRSTTVESEASDLLVKHATEYCQLLLNGRSVTPSEQRHTRQGECLCQFVESILVSGKTSCCKCIFGVKSRHPCRRYCCF